MLKYARLMIALAEFGLAQPKPVGFDTATIRFSIFGPGDLIVINPGSTENGKVRLAFTSLRGCIEFAYNLADVQLSSPSWMNYSPPFYDVVGDAPANTPRAQLLVMLQNLLTNRMKIVFHREQKELRYVALLRANTGTKLKPAKADPPLPGLIAGRRIHGNGTMLTLAERLSHFQHAPVIDMTGLTELYEVQLEWAMDETGQDNGKITSPSLSTAIQEQLGLKLEPRKGPVEVLTIDSAEKVPAEN